MTRIGLLGGMSWQSSAEYYKVLNEQVQQRVGRLHSASLPGRTPTAVAATGPAHEFVYAAVKFAQRRCENTSSGRHCVRAR